MRRLITNIGLDGEHFAQMPYHNARELAYKDSKIHAFKHELIRTPIVDSTHPKP